MKLNTRNYQAGIDLGTTNSAIAIYQRNDIEVLPISGNEILLPSCVYIHKDGTRVVGKEAVSLKNLDKDRNGHEGFKRQMGSNFLFPFDNLKVNLQAEELSGIILGKLQEVFNFQRTEKLHTAVVTVPAKFDLKQCDATLIASMGGYRSNNGFEMIRTSKTSQYYADMLHVELMMEPIAASMAYGMTTSKENSSWLVFDLGGGTFDAAVVNLHEGRMDIRHHAGHNYLGGRNFDELLFDYVVGKIKEKYDLTNFDKDDKFRVQRSMLKYVLEQLKIDLSSKEEVVVYIPSKELSNFTDNRGKEIKMEIVITRSLYNSIVGPKFQETIDICEKLLRSNKVKPSELERIILVGGPTQYPYFREQIQSQLGIQIDSTINPMTAVAKGAAIHAAAKEIPEKVKPEIIKILSKEPTDCQIELNCTHQTQNRIELVTGKIVMPDDKMELIDSISITREDGGWESGSIAVKPENGTFFTEVEVKENPSGKLMELNVYKIQIKGKQGASFTCTPDEFKIMYGKPPRNRSPFSLNVTIKDGKCVKVVEKDVELPAKKNRTFHTTEEVKKNSGFEELFSLYKSIEVEDAADWEASYKAAGEKLKEVLTNDEAGRTEKKLDESPEFKEKHALCQEQLKQLKKAHSKSTNSTESDYKNQYREVYRELKNLHSLAFDYCILYIELTEGESGMAEDNIHIGTLRIPSSELRRNLPVDTEIEVTIEATADRKVYANCYIPYIKQSFEAEIKVDRENKKSDTAKEQLDTLRALHKSKNSETEEYGKKESKDKYQGLNIESDINRIQQVYDQLSDKSEDSELYMEKLADISNITAETKLKIENFENEFIFERVENKLDFFDKHKKNGGVLEEKVAAWRESLRKAKESGSYESAKALEDEMMSWDPDFLARKLIMYLYGSSLTKQNNFAALLRMLMEQAQKVYNPELQVLLLHILLDWIKDVKDPDKTLIEIRPYLSRFSFEIRQIFDQLDAKEGYVIEDFDKVARIFNNHDDITSMDIVYDLAKVSNPSKKLLISAKNAAKAWSENRLEDFEKAFEEMCAEYYIDKAVFGSMGSKFGNKVGPIIDIF